jgi:hypothetical protein
MVLTVHVSPDLTPQSLTSQLSNTRKAVDTSTTSQVEKSLTASDAGQSILSPSFPLVAETAIADSRRTTKEESLKKNHRSLTISLAPRVLFETESQSQSRVLRILRSAKAGLVRDEGHNHRDYRIPSVIAAVVGTVGA